MADVGHRDDHLRNHGFVMTPSGWRLSPAFDLNPIVDKADHMLAIDDSDNRGDLDTALGTTELYGIKKDGAVRIAVEVGEATRHWRKEARKAGISNADIALTAAAFESKAQVS